MKRELKNLQTFGQHIDKNLNMPDISVFQLEELIGKIEDKITGILRKEGLSTKTMVINNSVSDTIRTFFKKIAINNI